MFPDIYNLHYEKFSDGTVKCIEDEIPFDLPQGWAWTRLNALFDVCSSKRVLQSEWRREGIPFYRAREIVKLSDNGFVNNDLFISSEHYEQMKSEYGVPQEGDLMVTGVGTIGRIYIVKSNDKFYYKDASVLCFKNRTGFVNAEYAKLLLESSFLQNQIHSKTYGNTVDTITISTANEYLCVVPPLHEQNKIVESVFAILEIVNKIKNNREDLCSCIASAKSKILDLAIRGKLVPQDPNDEPASVLLERIRAEKEALIKAGKIKRDKKESIIFKGEDNSYYEKIGAETLCIDELIPIIPYPNCEFVRLGTVLELLSGRDLKPDEYNAEHKGIPYITGASNFINGNVCVERWTTTPQVISTIGDLLITCKGTVGEMSFNTMGDVHIARQIMAIRNIYGLNMEYIFVCMMYYLNSIKEAAQGLIPGISRDIMLDLIIPLPSDKYQKEIVTAVKKSFDIICNIKNSVN